MARAAEPILRQSEVLTSTIRTLFNKESDIIFTYLMRWQQIEHQMLPI